LNIEHKYWVLIQRFISGNADEEQRQMLNEWMNRHPDNRKLVRELKEIWQSTPPEEFDVDVQAAWREFQNRKGVSTSHEFKKLGNIPGKTSKKLLYAMRVAAVVLVSLFAGIFVHYTLTATQDTEQVSDFYLMQTLETEKGEKARVTFSDGSRVVLNSASSVRFPQEFHGTKREVYLEGEAYFEVAHDPEHPFIVYAQDVEVEVLGTEFNVQSWSEDASIEVAVREGKVAVGSTGESSNSQDQGEKQVILTKGLYTSVEQGGIPSPPKTVNVTNHLLWTQGGLHFDNEPFNKVVRDIERRFNVQVAGVPDDLKDIPYTGTFQYADLDEVLSVIGASMEIEYRRDGSNIIIQ
jgi:ferric-dicitrate binding protein FerR (iron transport regulator)